MHAFFPKNGCIIFLKKDYDVCWAEGPAVHPAKGNALVSGKTSNSFIGPMGQPFARGTAKGWPVGPIAHNTQQKFAAIPLTRALPFAGRTAGPLGRNRLDA
jgi:hypothetical protein